MLLFVTVRVNHGVFIPTSSLLLNETGRTGCHGNPNVTCSEDRSGFPGPLEVTTQIYEGTNQIQRVVISKKLLG